MNEHGSTVVKVPRNAFLFCRVGMAVLLWTAFFLRLEWLVGVVAVLLALSAVLTVRRAPLVLLYTWTLGRFIRSRDEALDVRGMRFAHSLGALLGLVSLILLSLPDRGIGWRFVLFYCILKTVSAAGLCPGYKLYACMTSGTCCAFLRKTK
jgi:hypothetical protein